MLPITTQNCVNGNAERIAVVRGHGDIAPHAKFVDIAPAISPYIDHIALVDFDGTMRDALRLIYRRQLAHMDAPRQSGVLCAASTAHRSYLALS